MIIPSFAVGRTQELLYFFREIKQNHLIPEYDSFPVYVDSPLANEATAVFLQCDPVCLDQKTLEIMATGNNPIWFEGLHPTVSSDESKALNADKAPKVIIASSGMCEGGRIRHHLKHNIWDSRNTVLFAGYQASGTLGRIIYDGTSSVKIFGEEIDVKAQIALIPCISGHADMRGLISWISCFNKKPSFVFVNHGDDSSCMSFAETVTEQFGIPAAAPYAGSEYDLIRNEWIRLTDPEYRTKKTVEKAGTPEKRKKESVYRELRDAVEALDLYTKTLEGYSNYELKLLTQKILGLITDSK